jgi:SAM-dependent methyltransferase
MSSLRVRRQPNTPQGIELTEKASTVVSYQVANWRDQFESARTGLLKQLAYSAMWPLLNTEASRWLTEATLCAHEPAAVLRERGFPVEARRRWALADLNVSNSVILVQGTGSGWDVLTWARFRPKRIIATDLFAFDAWDEISRHCAAKWNVACEFRQAPLEDHAFLADGSVDLCVSDAVFEHCRDLGAVLAETRRLLKPGGRLYASYGPLWFCGGGDHYSGRGGLETLYNHLLLSPPDYKAYVDERRQDAEGFQDGHRYIELDLFSKLTTGDYLRAFRNIGLSIDALILEVSSPGLRFRKAFPSRYRQLLATTRGQCAPDDLIVKANLVRLTRNS